MAYLRRFISTDEATEFIERNRTIKILYLDKNASEREVANSFLVDFEDSRTKGFFTKALNKKYPKGLGWGGLRLGAGNKKGWNSGSKDEE